MKSLFNMTLSQYHNLCALIDVYSPAEISLSMILNPSDYWRVLWKHDSKQDFIFGILGEHFRK